MKAIAAAVEVVIWDGVWIVLRTRGLASLKVADLSDVSSWFTRPTDTDDGGDYDCKRDENTRHILQVEIRGL